MAAARRSACPVRTRRCPRRSCRPMPVMTWRAACSADRTTTASTVRRYRARTGPSRRPATRIRCSLSGRTRRAPDPRARKDRNRSASMRCRATWSGSARACPCSTCRRPTAASSTGCARRRRSRRWRARHRRPGRRVPAQRPVGCLAAACRPRHLVCRRQGGGPRPAGRGGRAQSGAGRPRQHRQRRPELRGDKRPGADIAITAGAGSAGPDYDALGKRYLTRPIAPWPARP